MTNHDIFRWPALVNGTQRQAFGQYVTFLLIPGVPLVYYGEEQSMYIFDNTAAVSALSCSLACLLQAVD